MGADFPLEYSYATFQGERFAIFNYNPTGAGGYVDVDWFRYDGLPGPNRAKETP